MMPGSEKWAESQGRFKHLRQQRHVSFPDMITDMVRLSKSRIMSSLQCLKRVHLEVNQAELAEYSPATRTAFEIGHRVGEIAVEVYGQGGGVYLEYEDGMQNLLRRTCELMGQAERVPVFEATLEYGGVLVREDVLLPRGDSWRVVEVKADHQTEERARAGLCHTGLGAPRRRLCARRVLPWRTSTTSSSTRVAMITAAS